MLQNINFCFPMFFKMFLTIITPPDSVVKGTREKKTAAEEHKIFFK